jgi:acetate---CoA ligase (ADP-forming)
MGDYKGTGLNEMFEPKSIAIVGVSQDPSKLGSVILTNLMNAGFEGEIYPVNPKYPEIFGYKSYQSVSEIPDDVDMVCVAVPAPFVKDVMEDAGKKGVKAAVVITAGFKEIGEEGAKMEKEILEIARKYQIRILGPNCLGLMTPIAGVNVSFAASNPLDGSVAFLSQSGAFCTAILDMSLEKNVGFSHFVSMGNKSDLDENEIIEYWFDRPEVKVMGAYLEEIANGQKLLEIVHRKNASKPVIIMKPGKTNEAKAAISSHTGSMAGSIQTFQTAMRQAGIIEAAEINHMFNLMMGFSWSQFPKGKNVAVITNAGGPGIMATDSIIEHGLKMAQLTDETRERIAGCLPSTASTLNPIDVIGDALAERYKAPIDILVEDENVDSILVILTPQLVTQIEETSKLIINTARLAKKPIFAVFLGGKYVINGLQRMYDNRVPAFRYIDDAVKVLKSMYEFGQLQAQSNQEALSRSNVLIDLGKGKYTEELRNEIVKGEVVGISEDLSIKLANEVGIDLPRQIVSRSIIEATEFAKDKYPVVIKATSDMIAHKTEEKALYLNIISDEELKADYTRLENMLKTKFNIDTPTILVQEMVKGDEEIFIGANRDGDETAYNENTSGFGHLLAFGKGGIFTEVYKDIDYALVPASRFDIFEAFKRTKVSQIVRGARGKDPLAMEEVLKTIEAIQKLVVLYPEIASVDINPLLLTKDRAVAVDVKIFVG